MTTSRPARLASRLLNFISTIASALFRIPVDPFEFLWGFCAAGWGVSVALDGDLFETLPRAYQYVAAPYGGVQVTPEMIGGVFFAFGVVQMGSAFANEDSRLPFKVMGRSVGFGAYGLKRLTAIGTLILWLSLAHAFFKVGASSAVWTYGFLAFVDGLIIARLSLLAKVRQLQGRGVLPVRHSVTVAFTSMACVAGPAFSS